ncbi:MAG TPA: response regulator transcription factor [Methylovirgula sp.]|nr:response regulator transcription factor [Methylovirgula sp.]
MIANAGGRRAALVVLSIENLSKQEIQRDLSSLRSIAPSTPVAIVAERGDLNDALDAIKMGAKGYISTSMGLDVALEAMQFVSAGGTYLPVECVLAAKQSSGKAAAGDSAGALTSRELAVIQAIRHGRSNKMIAYQLNMCESTVKVHVRHIMKKLRARNRTEVAIRAAEIVNFCD